GHRSSNYILHMYEINNFDHEAMNEKALTHQLNNINVLNKQNGYTTLNSTSTEGDPSLYKDQLPRHARPAPSTVTDQCPAYTSSASVIYSSAFFSPSASGSI
ncbi:hypothetical protein BgiBS90_016073, partial [Biomphalaria glabrata]